MMKNEDVCKCKDVKNLIDETNEKIKKHYSNYKLVNADFIRTQKAMFFEKVKTIYKK